MKTLVVTLFVVGLTGSGVAAIGAGVAEASSHSRQRPQFQLIVKGLDSHQRQAAVAKSSSAFAASKISPNIICVITFPPLRIICEFNCGFGSGTERVIGCT